MTGIKVAGNGKQVRHAMLAEALAEDGAEPVDLPPPAEVLGAGDGPGRHAALETVPGPALPAPSFDMQAFALMLAAAMTSSGHANAAVLEEALSKVAASGRTANPSNINSPGVSVYSHPDGDLATPRTTLRCPMFLGIIDETGRVVPAFEIFAETCTEAERTMLNSVVPGTFRVERNDGLAANWMVSERRDDNGVLNRLTIAVPPTWLSSAEQAQMPGQPSFLRQLTAEAS